MSVKKIFKTISFVLLVIFGLIGFIYTIGLFLGSSDHKNTQGISVVQNSPAQSENQEDKEDISFYYSEPKKIDGSRYSIMEVLVKGDGKGGDTFKRIKYHEEPYIVNILFFNLTDNQFNLLFRKKALLGESYFTYNLFDSSSNKLFFSAITYDTDKDGKLSQEDNHVLYSCEKNGLNLIQVSETKVNLEQFTFLNKKTLLLTVSIPVKEEPKHKWKRKYIQYDIEQNRSFANNKFSSILLDAIDIIKK